jgi:hypothetical protein
LIQIRAVETRGRDHRCERERIPPITDILIVSVIAFAFLAFAMIPGAGGLPDGALASERALSGSDANPVALKGRPAAGRARRSADTNSKVSA